MSSEERGSGGGVALDGTLGQRPRRAPCRYLFPRQQSRVACEQWDRMVDCVVAAASRSKAPPASSSSAVVDHGPGGCRGTTPSRIAVLRQSLDPGLVRFVQTETAAALKGSAPRLNSGLDGYEQLDEEGTSLYRGRTLVSPREASVRQCDGVMHSIELSDDHSSCCQLGMTPWKDAGRCYSPGLKG